MLSFLASVGGIFGLLMGASIISFIEIIYFVVVRIVGPILFSTYSSDEKKKHEAKSKQQNDKQLNNVHNRRANRLICHQYIP